MKHEGTLFSNGAGYQMLCTCGHLTMTSDAAGARSMNERHQQETANQQWAPTPAMAVLIAALEERNDYASLTMTTRSLGGPGAGWADNWVIATGMDGEPIEHATPPFKRIHELEAHCRTLLTTLVHKALDDWKNDFIEDALNPTLIAEESL